MRHFINLVHDVSKIVHELQDGDELTIGNTVTVTYKKESNGTISLIPGNGANMYPNILIILDKILRAIILSETSVSVSGKDGNLLADVRIPIYSEPVADFEILVCPKE